MSGTTGGKLPYQDRNLPVEERVRDLLGRMTLREKARQLDQYFGTQTFLSAAHPRMHTVLAEGDGNRPRYHGVAEALAEPDTMLRLFGKPEVKGKRRMAVTLARDESVDAARAKARRAAEKLRVEL